MDAEVAFLTGYALVLVAVSLALDALGRRSTDPWASRVLAASRPPDHERRDDEPSWPHAEVPTFHLGLSGVALAAALVITGASLFRHRDPVELAVGLAVLALVVARSIALAARLRASTQTPLGRS